MDAKDLINKITNDDIIKLMSYLGSNLSPRSNDKNLIFQSICHHEEVDNNDFKLYYYPSSKNFYCYQKCGRLSIFDVVMKSKEIDFKSSLDLVESIVGGFSNKPKIGFGNETKIYNTDLKEVTYEELAPIKKQYLYNIFRNEVIRDWEKEKISKESMQKYNIRYDDRENRIIIPHFSMSGKCVGIRCRNMNKRKLMNGLAKYMPLYFNGEGYNHALGKNLYGINISKDNIKETGKCIVFEGEKSVLKYDSYFKKNIAVAICGSNFSSIQKKMLVDLNVKEVILALDKEFEVYGDDESKMYEQKLIKQLDNLKDYCKCSYIIDKDNLLDKKDAPIDKGKNILTKLINDRVIVR